MNKFKHEDMTLFLIAVIGHFCYQECYDNELRKELFYEFLEKLYESVFRIVAGYFF